MANRYLGRSDLPSCRTVYRDRDAAWDDTTYTCVLRPAAIRSLKKRIHSIQFTGQDFYGLIPHGTDVRIAINSGGKTCLLYSSEAEGSMTTAEIAVWNAIHDAAYDAIATASPEGVAECRVSDDFWAELIFR